MGGRKGEKKKREVEFEAHKEQDAERANRKFWNQVASSGKYKNQPHHHNTAGGLEKKQTVGHQIEEDKLVGKKSEKQSKSATNFPKSYVICFVFDQYIMLFSYFG